MDHKALTEGRTANEDHRTSRTETHCCSKGELESVAPTNLQRYILVRNNYLVLGFGMRKEEPHAL